MVTHLSPCSLFPGLSTPHGRGTVYKLTRHSLTQTPRRRPSLTHCSEHTNSSQSPHTHSHWRARISPERRFVTDTLRFSSPPLRLLELLLLFWIIYNCNLFMIFFFICFDSVYVSLSFWYHSDSKADSLIFIQWFAYSLPAHLLTHIPWVSHWFSVPGTKLT